LLALVGAAPVRAAPPALRRQGTATQLVVGGRPFVILGGELHNSSASSLAYLEPIWPRLAKLGVNTVLVPVSWELLEPREGELDFTLVVGLVKAARKHHLKLVLLWFGSWKNGASSYVPGWVKTDPERYPRVERRGGQRLEVLSPFATANRDADARALAALLRRLRELDERDQTVLMVQIENEVGLLGDSRDRSRAAEQAFASAVPPELTGYLQGHRDELDPELAGPWRAAGARVTGTWTEVFGAGADEVFMAWHYGRYVEHVAAGGKKEYALPMFVNAWLRKPGDRPGKYPSGGPVSPMLDVWRAAAPSIDVRAPDIYLPDFATVTASYARNGGPLFIPEAAGGPEAAAKAFYAFGQHAAIGFAPFGIDALAPDHPIGAAYRVLAEVMPTLAPRMGHGRTLGLLQEGGKERDTAELDGLRVEASYRAPSEAHPLPGHALLVEVGPDELFVAGAGVALVFRAQPPLAVGVLAVDEGHFQAGQWRPGRRLNGDEGGGNKVILPSGPPVIRRVRLYRYQATAPAGEASP
jgi:hypothetical protein